MQMRQEHPGGWKFQREVSITQYDPDPVKHARKESCLDVIEETEIIPVGWKSQREAGNIQQNPLKIEDRAVGEREDSWEMELSGGGQQHPM